MAHIKPIELSMAEGKSRELLEDVKKQMGTVLNIFKGLAHSPATLEFYLAQSKALAGGALDAKLREQIAVTMAGANQCDYCASAHTYLGKKAGVSEAELTANLAGRSQDGKTATALRFARAVAENRGRLGDEELQRVRDAGFSDAEIVEIIAHVGMNLFTNFFNNLAGTEVDFPRVNTSRRKVAAY
jgi:uncharacterized peroxidase-related enzyme